MAASKSEQQTAGMDVDAEAVPIIEAHDVDEDDDDVVESITTKSTTEANDTTNKSASLAAADECEATAAEETDSNVRRFEEDEPEELEDDVEEIKIKNENQ